MSAKAVIIRELAKEYWKEYRSWQWAKEVEEEGYGLSTVEEVMPMVGSKEDEVLSAWRRQKGRAHIPEDVRMKLLKDAGLR